LTDCNSAYETCQEDLTEATASESVVDKYDLVESCSIPGAAAFQTAIDTVDSIPEGASWCVDFDAAGSDGEFVLVLEDGSTYRTCVAYGWSKTISCDNDQLMCGDSDNDQTGYGGQQGDRLVAAMVRNDFKHPDCPSIQDECEPWTGWWQGRFEMFTGLGSEYSQNVCVNTLNGGHIRFVEQNQWVNTCVGYAESYSVVCPNDRDFACSKMVDGLLVYGYPSDISKMLASALQQQDLKVHPQCAGLL